MRSVIAAAALVFTTIFAFLTLFVIFNTGLDVLP